MDCRQRFLQKQGDGHRLSAQSDRRYHRGLIKADPCARVRVYARVLYTGPNPELSLPVRRQWTLYVIDLKKTVLRLNRFHAANPEYIPGKPCVYVGVTWL